MADQSLFAGPAIRRLRKREGMTQASTAARLEISPSYLNLIERNQRPVSARVMMRLVEQFDFDPRSLRADEAIGGVDGLADGGVVGKDVGAADGAVVGLLSLGTW